MLVVSLSCVSLSYVSLLSLFVWQILLLLLKILVWWSPYSTGDLGGSTVNS
jgi:hypothetical protein